MAASRQSEASLKTWRVAGAEPERPASCIQTSQREHGAAIDDEPAASDIGGLLQIARHLRCADREYFLLHKQFGRNTGPLPGTDADADIDVGCRQIDEACRRIDAQFDIRKTRGEAIEPPHQPAGGEDGCHRDRQRRVVPALRDRDGLRHTVEALRQCGKHRRARLRHHHALRRALENQLIELRFGLDNLLTDGTDRHPKFFRGKLQRTETPDGLQRAQPVQMHRVEIPHIYFL